MFDDTAPQRPALAVLCYVSPAAFGPRHLEHLRRLEANSADGTTALDWAYRIAHGEVWLWELRADAAPEQPVVLTSTLGLPPETLFLEGAAGSGILKNAAAILADLRTIARHYGCTQLRAMSGREGFDALPDKLGFQAVATVWQLEVNDDGQQAPEGNDDHQ